MMGEVSYSTKVIGYFSFVVGATHSRPQYYESMKTDV